MLWVYVPRGTSLDRIAVTSDADVPDSAVWFDLVHPALEEDKIVERKVGAAVPTREEMQEIEVTSRLYVENGARYMTATLMCQSDTHTPKTTPVTFIISGHRLITVRYDEPRPFMIVGNKLARNCSPTVGGESVLMDLLDAVIDRAADILERIGSEVDQISHDIFEPEAGGFKPALTWFHRGSEADAEERLLVDIVDLDGDGLAEVIAEGFYYESNDYIIYKKRQGHWVSVYQGGGGGC